MKLKILKFNPERKLPTWAVFLILLTLNLLFLFIVEGSGWPWPTVDRAFSYFLVIFAFLAAGLGIELWNTLAARWFTFAGITAILFLTTTWWKFPDAILLVALLVGLVAAMIGLRASLFSAMILTLLLLEKSALVPNVSQAEANLAIFACWMMFGVMLAIYRPFQLTIQLLENQLDQVKQFLVDARDRKAALERALESLANANRQLALANKKMAVLSEIAEDAQKAKTAFVANVSHEFRTPLNMITGLIDLMTRNPENYDVILSPKMREDFDVIYRNCEHLSNMVNDVLDLTRVETGRLVLYREWVDLHEIIKKAITVVHPLIEKKHLELKLDLPPELPAIYCDRTRIQQVVLNLLSNAARFTENGTIHLKVAEKNQSVQVEVIDTGPGIALEDRERIFEPFWQGHDPIWQKKGGSGIGLSLSREFVDLHGGRMWFDSNVGEGSTFYFTIPVSPLVDPMMKAGHFIKDDWLWREDAFLSAQSKSTNEIVKPRVILFDQTETLYPRFVRYTDQVEIIPIQDIDQVAGEGSARAFILNASSIKALWPLVETAFENAATTPIIGCSVPGEYRRALELGAKGYLIKPIRIDDLIRVINTFQTPVRRIMIVDDDPDVLNLYQRMLEAHDPELMVTTVSNGEDALELVRKSTPDLMFLDVVMPVMNGWQVLETLCQENLSRLFPIYFITAQDPVDQLASGFILAAIKGGIPLGKLLRGSLDLATLLMAPAQEPDQGLPQNFAV